MKDSQSMVNSKVTEMETKDVSRRSFIGTAGKVVAAGALGHFFLVGSAKAEEPLSSKQDSILRACGSCDKCDKCEKCNECQKCVKCEQTCQTCNTCQKCVKSQHE